jgi:hypothetical protein
VTFVLGPFGTIELFPPSRLTGCSHGASAEAAGSPAEARGSQICSQPRDSAVCVPPAFCHLLDDII